MKIPRILLLTLAGTGLITSPAHADDHDKDKKHKKHSHEYYYHHRPSVTIGVAGPRRPYYGSSSTVIVERERPVYDERQSYSTRSSYPGGSMEMDIQRGLARRGYYRGAVDGDIGPGSRSAIRAFQADNGFAPTGRIDRGLLEALR